MLALARRGSVQILHHHRRPLEKPNLGHRDPTMARPPRAHRLQPLQAMECRRKANPAGSLLCVALRVQAQQIEEKASRRSQAAQRLALANSAQATSMAAVADLVANRRKILAARANCLRSQAASPPFPKRAALANYLALAVRANPPGLAAQVSSSDRAALASRLARVALANSRDRAALASSSDRAAPVNRSAHAAPVSRQTTRLRSTHHLQRAALGDRRNQIRRRQRVPPPRQAVPRVHAALANR